MEDLLTAVPRSGVQPLASGDRIQYDVRAKRPMSEEELYEVMIMSGALASFERDSREAAAAEAAIEAEAEAVENEDDDALRVRLRCSRRIIEQPLLWFDPCQATGLHDAPCLV